MCRVHTVFQQMTHIAYATFLSTAAGYEKCHKQDKEVKIFLVKSK